MFTRNFMKLLCCRMFCFANNTITGYGTTMYIKDTTNSNTDIQSNQNQNMSSYNSAAEVGYKNRDVTTTMATDAYSNLMCRVGTGTTEPTIDDYMLEAIIPSTTLEIQAQNYDMSTVANNQLVHLTYIFSNKTQEDVTINEIGLFTKSNYISGNTRPCLIWREVLSEPIVIKAGKSKSISIDLDFSKING